MDKVILFLHERTTRQLAALHWESLYVAYTRVKSANDIRVCYFGSDTSCDRTGLKHLKKLHRPELFDVWQSGYDKKGNWNGRNLAHRARQKRIKLRRKFQFVTSLTQAGVKTLKEWADILDVVVPNKPGTQYKTKPQYVQALRPIWIGVNGGTLTCEGTLGRPKHTSRRLATVHKPTPPLSPVRNKSVFTNTITSTPDPTPQRRLAQAPAVSAREIRSTRRSVSDLHTNFKRYSSTQLARSKMQQISYCINLQYVGECSQWDAFQLATPGRFVGDTVVHYFASHFSQDSNSRAYTVDPLLRLGSPRLLRRGIHDKLLERLHDLGQIILFPLNVPVNSHWVIVLVWLNSRGELVIQCRNSMSRLRHNDAACCRDVETYMQSLYQHASNNDTYTCPTLASTPLFNAWTEQTPNVYACGLHVISQAYLASRGLAHTHTFDNDFVKKMRSYCVYTWYTKRLTRTTTLMRPVDLTSDYPRLRDM